MTSRDEQPPIAAQASVLGLAAVFNVTPATMLDDAVCLSQGLAAVVRWRPALANIDGVKVEVAWQGDFPRVKDGQRSFRLAELAPLAAVPGMRLVSLQKGRGPDKLADAEFPVPDLGHVC